MQARFWLPLGALALAGATPPETRSLFAVKEFPAFQVMVPQDKAAWCGETARVTITAQSADQLVQNQAVVERIVGGVRAVMSFECPQAQRIVLTGKVAGEPVYQASAAAAGGWKLAGIETRSPEQISMMADLETVGRCDELAAHPEDPEAMANGVPDDGIDATAAIASCRKAVALDSETPRFRFQLARALLSAGQEEDALEQLVPAAQAGHGGSLALLGDIYLNGAAGMDADPIMARQLYEQALAAGFTPAKAVLAQYDDHTAELAQAEKEEQRFAAQQAAYNAQEKTRRAKFVAPKQLTHRPQALALRDGRIAGFQLAQETDKAMKQTGMADSPLFNASSRNVISANDMMRGTMSSSDELMTRHYVDGFLTGYTNMCSGVDFEVEEDLSALKQSWTSRYVQASPFNIIAAMAMGGQNLQENTRMEGELDGGEIALADNCSSTTYANATRAFAEWLKR